MKAVYERGDKRKRKKVSNYVLRIEPYVKYTFPINVIVSSCYLLFTYLVNNAINAAVHPDKIS